MIAVRILTLALASLGVAHACVCDEPTVLVARQRAVVVFRGTITALRPAENAVAIYKDPGDTGKIAIFRVSRVWKGEVGPTFGMLAVVETGSCWGFAPQLLKIGAELIVYAQLLDGTGMGYQTTICSLTRFIKYAAKDLEELGPGEEPKADRPSRNPKSK